MGGGDRGPVPAAGKDHRGGEAKGGGDEDDFGDADVNELLA